jgi:hypothetical protein
VSSKTEGRRRRQGRRGARRPAWIRGRRGLPVSGRGQCVAPLRRIRGVLVHGVFFDELHRFEDVVGQVLDEAARGRHVLALPPPVLRHRVGDEQVLLRPRHGHVEEAQLLVDPARLAERVARGNGAVERPDQEDGVEFEALRRVDGRQHEGGLVVLPGLLVQGGQLDGIERERGEEAPARLVVGGEAGQVLQVRGPLRVVVGVLVFEERLVVVEDGLHLLVH